MSLDALLTWISFALAVVSVAMGQHDLADPIPSALDQAAERTLAWIWHTARTRTAAGSAAGPAASDRPAEPAAAGA
jgi:hypothetical protein